MPSLTRIARLASWLYWAATGFGIALPLAFGVALFKGWSDPAFLAARFADLPAATTVGPVKALLVIAAGALALPVLLAALWQMRALFRRYGAGEILTDACARHVLRIGQMLVALAALGVAIPTLQRLILTWDNPVGQKVLAIGLSSDTMGFLLAGGLLFVVGWVMGEAARVAADNAGFI